MNMKSVGIVIKNEFYGIVKPNDTFVATSNKIKHVKYLTVQDLQQFVPFYSCHVSDDSFKAFQTYNRQNFHIAGFEKMISLIISVYYIC